MHIFLIGLDVADDSAIFHLAFGGEFSVVDLKRCVRSLNVSDPLEDATNLVVYCPGTFVVVRSLHEVTLFLDLSYVRADYRVHLDCFDGDSPHVGDPDFQDLSSLAGFYG